MPFTSTTVTTFAVLIAETRSLLSPIAATAFGIVCVVAVGLALAGESRRDRLDKEDIEKKSIANPS